MSFTSYGNLISRYGTKLKIKTFTTAYRFGIKIAFGTDSGVSYHGDNAKEFVYMVKGGMLEMEAIKSATIVNSLGPKPLVVQAGVPNRIPEVIIGLWVSNGIPFLLQVIFDLTKEASASLPVTLKSLKSSNIKWVSVPPEKILKPFFDNLSERIFALFITSFE